MADRLAEIKARLAAATPGPWRWDEYTNIVGPTAEDGSPLHVLSTDGGIYLSPDDPDGELVVRVPEDMAWLVAEVERLREALSEIAHRTYEERTRSVAEEALGEGYSP